MLNQQTICIKISIQLMNIRKQGVVIQKYRQRELMLRLEWVRLCRIYILIKLCRLLKREDL